MNEPRVFDTPEDAALASYSPAAEAFVLRVEPIDEQRVDVIVDMVPSHPMRSGCRLTGAGWIEEWDIVDNG